MLDPKQASRTRLELGLATEQALFKAWAQLKLKKARF